jgi:death on curing protein
VTWRWVSRRVLEAIHLRQIQRHGGGQGIRDVGLLESALARPEQLAHDGEPDVFDLAAAYAFGLARNHPFVDGNKRTAFVVSTTFLGYNGFRFDGGKTESVVVLLRLAAGDLREDELAGWFRENSSPPDDAYLVPEQDQ